MIRDKYKLLLCLVLLGSLAGLWGITATNQERYDYKYIMLLYDKGYNDILDSEINKYYSEYPASEYLPYLSLLKANILLEAGDYAQAQELYDALLSQKLELNAKNELYLNRARNLYYQKAYSAAITQLQLLESSSTMPELLQQAQILKARIYAALGQSYSAMRAYEQALSYKQSPQILYEYLESLLWQNKLAEAMATLKTLETDEYYQQKALVLYLQYLYNNEYYQDFQYIIAENPWLESLTPVQVMLLSKAISDEDYVYADAILAEADLAKDSIAYFYALNLVHKDETAEADAIFMRLVKEATPELKVLSFLERLKILYKKEPVAAMLQLGQYLQNPANTTAKAEQHLTMGFFAYQKQDYPEALKQFNLARGFSTQRQKLAEIDLYIAKSWLKAQKNNQARDAFNRYLALYPQGKNRDTALFYLGFIHFEQKDYNLAKAFFGKLTERYPESTQVPPAKFYLAEMDYYLANYTSSLNAFLSILAIEPDNSDVALRVAQIYYYMQNYEEAGLWVEKLIPSYDSLTLQGHLSFIQKDYNAALQLFKLSERATANALQITESKSYQALCLYQLKRFNEATELYLSLFEGSNSPDTYLYLGAKSSYAAGDYHQALELFEGFIDLYPDSQYYLPVLADIANSYYNLGNYGQASRDYMNILIRYRNHRVFNDDDRKILGDVFTGLELALKRADDPVLLQDALDLSGTFQSLYISFELAYIIVNLYADNAQWQELLSSAAELRRLFPEEKRNEIELLMAESLVNLQEYEEAGELLQKLYQDTQDLEALNRWAEIDYLAQDYTAALAKYSEAFQLEASADIWYNMLKTSIAAEYYNFEEIWTLGAEYQDAIPQVRLLRLRYFSDNKEYDGALELTDSIINESVSPYEHAQAFLYKGIIRYQEKNFDHAIADFNKVMLLFPDFPGIQDEAGYYIILSYLELDDYDAAQSLLFEFGQSLSPMHLEIINQLLEEKQ